jgi:DNA-binding NarL/FixJ family response regulator
MPIRLAIVESQTLVRYGLCALVAHHHDIEIVAECPTMAEATRKLACVRPDVVTVAVDIPDGNGLQLARNLRDCRADLGIVIMTARGGDDILFRAMETGVSAFVEKTAPLEEVLAAIRHSAVAASSFTAASLANALARRRAVDERLALSSRELEVLRLLRDGLPIPAIAQQMYISYSTARTYVARLYQKLGAANRTQALMIAMGYGLLTLDGDGSASSLRMRPSPREEAHTPRGEALGERIPAAAGRISRQRGPVTTPAG